MTLQKEEAIRLLDKFMEGATSLEEERLIAQFLQSEEAGEEFADYKLMFDTFATGQPSFSEEELNDIASLPAVLVPRRASKWLTIGKWTAVACLVVLSFFIGTRISETSPTETETKYITQTVTQTDTVFVEKPIEVTKYITKNMAQKEQTTDIASGTLAHSDIEEEMNMLIEDFDLEKEIRDFNNDINNFSDLELSL